MLEKRISAVLPQLFIANGTSNGIVTISDTRLFKVKQKVYIKSNTVASSDSYEIKRILSTTQMIVGPDKTPLHTVSDLSMFLVADNAIIGANEQFRPSIPVEEISRAVYEEEPTVALRTLLVDKLGDPYTLNNPLPVQLSNGSINIGTVNAELEVQLSHIDNFPNPGDVHDSVRIGDGINTITATSTNIFKYPIDSVSLNRLIRREYDDIEVLTKNADGDPLIIAFRSNSSLVATLNLIYDLDGDFVRAQVTYV